MYFFPLLLIFHFNLSFIDLNRPLKAAICNPDFFETKHMTDCDIPFPLHNVGVMSEVSL